MGRHGVDEGSEAGIAQANAAQASAAEASAAEASAAEASAAALQSVSEYGAPAELYLAALRRRTGRRVEELLGPGAGLRADLAGGELAFVAADGAKELPCRAHLVAAVSVDPPVAVWGWSHPAAGPASLAARIGEAGEQQGVPALATAELPFAAPAGLDPAQAAMRLAHILGRAAAQAIGPRPNLAVRTGDDGSLAVVLLEGPELRAPEVLDVIAALPTVLADLPDVGAALAECARLRPDWSLEAEAPSPGVRRWRLADPFGAIGLVEETRDAEGRRNGLSCSVEDPNAG